MLFAKSQVLSSPANVTRTLRMSRRSGLGIVKTANMRPRLLSHAPHPAPRKQKFEYISMTKSPSSWNVEAPDPLKNFLTFHHPELAKPSYIHKTLLRDACTCSACVDPSSGQKRFATCDIPEKLQIGDAARCEDGSLEIRWENDFLTNGSHVSRYPPHMIDRGFGGKAHRRKTFPKFELWDRATLESRNPFFDYQQFMSGGSEYFAAMSTLRAYGMFFLRQVPSSEKAVEDITTKVGVLLNTFYGRTWDVKSKPDAENVAYTNSYLGLHQDLLYMGVAPRIQLLHCLKNTCNGGESTFSDGLRTGLQMKARFPAYHKALTERPILYHYEKGGHLYRSGRPVLSNDSNAFWSPPFQNPIQHIQKTKQGVGQYESWVRGARRFKELLEAEEYVYEYKMEPGDCVVFDNLRVLHGRREFDTSSGERWLKGAYVDNDSFISKLNTICEDLPVNDGTQHLRGQVVDLLERHGKNVTETW